MYTRYEMDRADALVGAGQKDAARTILKALAARFPTTRRIQDKLDKIK
jgi:TolA-binding protein